MLKLFANISYSFHRIFSKAVQQNAPFDCSKISLTKLSKICRKYEPIFRTIISLVKNQQYSSSTCAVLLIISVLLKQYLHISELSLISSNLVHNSVPLMHTLIISLLLSFLVYFYFCCVSSCHFFSRTVSTKLVLNQDTQCRHV